MNNELSDMIRCVFPSGRHAKCYEMQVSDVNRLANPKKRDEALQDILSMRIVFETEDEKSEEAFNSRNALIADLFTGMVMVRRATHGDVFQYNIQCNGCRKVFEHESNLGDDRFAIKPIQWATGDDVTSGVDPETYQFVIKLSKPHQGISDLRCQLLVGHQQQKLTKLQSDHSERQISEMMKLRIVGFDGKINTLDKDKAPDQQRLLKPTDAWLDSMPLRLQREFNRKYDEFDGGIETSIDVECVYCGHTSKDSALPFRDTNFFLPR